MAKLSVGSGTTGRIEYIYIVDSLSSTGLGKTNISFNTSGLSGHYVRNAGTAVTITFISQTATGSWNSGGWAEVDSVRLPGIYRVDLPDAIFQSGSDKAIIMIRGVANTIPVTLEYQITANDPNTFTNASIANTIWTNTTRTITGGIADTVTTLTNRAGFAITGGIITGGIADTVTTLTNRAGFAITGGTITTNNDKSGYSLSQSFPANFSSLLISGGKVSIVQTDIDSILDNIPEVNYSGIAATTWNFLSSAIGNTLSIGYKLANNIDTPISTRSTLTSQQVINAIQASVKSISQVNKDKISKL